MSDSILNKAAMHRQAYTMQNNSRDLVAAQAVFIAVAGVEAPAHPRPHSPRPALALQGGRPADPVLHQQAHAAPWIMPPLL